jgi:hypothetical protein
MASRSAPPNFEIPPLVRKRQKITVAMRRNERICGKRVISLEGEAMRTTNPRTRVIFVKFDPIIPPIAK